jgi:antibiotic biosynthesis monooxygenase (ABM) superfamily enzyme
VEVRTSRASAVAVQRVAPEAVEQFLQWQRGITAAAETFAGYQGTDIYPPTDGKSEEWVVLLHFTDEPALQQWLRSQLRAQWVEKRPQTLGAFTLKTLPGGFGFWFAGKVHSPEEVPPSWKMVLTVLLGLYPTVMLLTIFVGPYTSPLGLAVSMLIGNALSVSLLQWTVMPVLTPLLRRWLRANGRANRALSLGVVGLILLLLGAMTFAFHLATR